TRASTACCRSSRRRRPCALLRSAAFRGGWCCGSDSREGAMADEARRRPIEDVREISAITYGFMASKALFAALEFDLFAHIAQGAASTSPLTAFNGSGV